MSGFEKPNYENLNLKNGEDTRFAEMQKEKKGLQEPVDGEDVGNPDAQTDKNKEQKDKNEKQNTPVTPEELQKIKQELLRGKETVYSEAEKHQDWPPAKGNPEAEQQLAGDLEKSLNAVV